MDHIEYTKLMSKNPASLNIQPRENVVKNLRYPEGFLSIGWSCNPPRNNSDDQFSLSANAVHDSATKPVTGQLIPARDASVLSDTAEIHITCSCKSLRKPKRLNSKKPKSVFHTRNSCSQLIISLPLKAVLDRSNQKLLRESGYFNSTALDVADSHITNVLTSTLAVGLKKMSVGGQLSMGSSKHIGKHVTWKVDSCMISRRSNDSYGALGTSSDDSSWNNITSLNPFRSNTQCRLSSSRAITSGREPIDSNNTGCIDLTDLSRVLDSTLDDSSTEVNSNNNGTSVVGQSCAASMPTINEDFSVEDLSGYFEDFCHIPKKMSLMAELMYA